MAVLGLYMLLVTAPHLAAQAGGLPMLDARLGGYAPHEVRRYLEALGADGRGYYANVQIPVDTAFVVIEWLTISAIIIWFTRPGARFAIALPSWARLTLLVPPLLQAAFDHAENGMIRHLLLAATPDDVIARTASFATQAKWIAAGLAVGAALTLAVAAALRGYARRRT